METHVALVGQIYWDSLCQRRRTNVHCEKSGVTYAARRFFLLISSISLA